MLQAAEIQVSLPLTSIKAKKCFAFSRMPACFRDLYIVCRVTHRNDPVHIRVNVVLTTVSCCIRHSLFDSIVCAIIGLQAYGPNERYATNSSFLLPTAGEMRRANDNLRFSSFAVVGSNLQETIVMDS
jgi:hypothetical protein